MDVRDLALPLALAVAAALFLVLYLRAERRGRAAAADAARLGGETEARLRLGSELDAERQKSAEMQGKIQESLRRQAEAETRLQEADKAINTLRTEHKAAVSELSIGRLAQQESEMQVALARKEVEGMKQRMTDWEKTKAESIEAAKAAALASATAMSNKLIADHKRESEEAKKRGEEQIKKTTEGLTGQFTKIVDTVNQLHSQVGETRTTVDTVHRALSSPGGAGHFAEIGLENLLKQMALEPGRDFRMQHSVAGDGERGGLRPDAVVFLPNNSVMVIDSKASKFLLELAEAEGTEAEEQAHARLARTMNLHLRALTAKDYKSAIIDAHHKSGRGGELGRVISIMYLPNEGALEKVNIADPEFDSKALKADIITAGPTGLTGLVGFASMEIGLARQDENRDRIVDQTAALLESVNVLLGHADKVGRGIKSAADNFRKLSSSVNSRLLPRARGLIGLGVQPGGKKEMHGSLPTYQVVATEEMDLIEGEAEEVSPRVELTNQREET